MKINKKISLCSLYLDTIKRHEAEIQGLLHSAQTNRGYFHAWFQSLQLPSTQSESPLAPKSHVSFKVYSQLWIKFFIFSTVSIATGYQLDDRRGRSSSYSRVKNFLFSTSSRPVLGPTQPPFQWVLAALSPGVKRPLEQLENICSISFNVAQKS
jgi:hypothetical protein